MGDNGFTQRPSSLYVPSKDVSDFHNNDDVDSGQQAHHHTLGIGALQAAPGNHKHDDPIHHMNASTYKVQLIPSGVWTNVNFWSPASLENGIKIGGGPEGRTNFTVSKTGIYDIKFTTIFRNEVSSAGARGAGINLNGGFNLVYYAAPIAAQADYASSAVSMTRKLTAGDYITFIVLQNTGGNVNIDFGVYTHCSITRLGASI